MRGAAARLNTAAALTMVDVVVGVVADGDDTVADTVAALQVPHTRVPLAYQRDSVMIF